MKGCHGNAKEKKKKEKKILQKKVKKQGRIHGQYQSRTVGQGWKCVFSHFSTQSPRADQPTNGRTRPLIESLVREKENRRKKSEKSFT